MNEHFIDRWWSTFNARLSTLRFSDDWCCHKMALTTAMAAHGFVPVGVPVTKAAWMKAEQDGLFAKHVPEQLDLDFT